jgi:hypothetical protein
MCSAHQMGEDDVLLILIDQLYLTVQHGTAPATHDVVVDLLQSVERLDGSDAPCHEGSPQGTPILRLLKVMDACDVSHKQIHEIRTILAIDGVNDSQITKSEKKLNSIFEDFFHVDPDRREDGISIVSADPQRILDLLLASLDLGEDPEEEEGLEATHVHVVYIGDGRTFDGRTTTIVSMRIVDPFLSVVFPIAVIDTNEDYDSFDTTTCKLRSQLQALSLGPPGEEQKDDGLSVRLTSSSSPPSSSSSSSSAFSSSSSPASSLPLLDPSSLIRHLSTFSGQSESAVAEQLKKNVLAPSQPPKGQARPPPFHNPQRPQVIPYLGGDMKFLLIVCGQKSASSK